MNQLLNHFYAPVDAVNSYYFEKALNLKRRDWPEFRRAYTNYQAALDALAEIDKETR